MFFFLFLQSKLKMMARQLGPIYIKGTLDDLTFYQMDGEHYVRMKSRLTKKKVLTCPRFALTRMHASQLAEASRIASIIYRQLPKEERNIKLFRSIVGKAKVLLWTGKNKEEVIESLNQSAMVNGECSIIERSEVKSERSKVRSKKIVRRQKSGVKVEMSEILLVNEAGRLMEKLYKSVSVFNYMVLDPSTSLSRGSG